MPAAPNVRYLRVKSEAHLKHILAKEMLRRHLRVESEKYRENSSGVKVSIPVTSFQKITFSGGNQRREPQRSGARLGEQIRRALSLKLKHISFVTKILSWPLSCAGP